MVHGGHHWLDRFAVSKGQHRHLGPGEELFHHHVGTGSAELFVQHDLFDAGLGVGFILADQHTLAQRKAVGLDHHRIFALGADVGHGGIGVAEGFVFGGGNAVFLHQIFREHLGGLDAGGRLVGAKGRDAHRGQRVHHAKGKGVVLRYDGIVKAFCFGKLHHSGYIGGLDVFAFGVKADAAVAGGTPDFAALGALLQCPDDGMLAAAAAHYQNFHTKCSFYVMFPLGQKHTERRSGLSGPAARLMLSDGTAAGRRRPWQCRTCCRCR